MKRFIYLLSKERAAAYKLNKNETDLDNLNRYLFNIALGQSFYPLLNMLEICLRNKINNMFISDFGIDWITRNNFFDDKTLLKVNELVDQIKKRRKMITNNRLVSELTFGFWTSLLNNNYNILWQQKNRIGRVFNGLKMDIRKINRELSIIRTFRNRVFHFETLFNHHPGFCYDLIMKYLKAVANNEEFIQIIERMDTVKVLINFSYNDVRMLDFAVKSIFKLGRCAEDNPDLPLEFIKECLLAKEEALKGKVKEMQNIADTKEISAKIASGEMECFPESLVSAIIHSKNKIKAFREYRKITQAELAEKSGVSIHQIRKIEAGKSEGSVKTLKAIAKALSLDLEDIA